jgi:hypothetical protein
MFSSFLFSPQFGGPDASPYPNRLSHLDPIGTLRNPNPSQPDALIVLGLLAEPLGPQSSPTEVRNDPARPAYAAKRVPESGTKHCS